MTTNENYLQLNERQSMEAYAPDLERIGGEVIRLLELALGSKINSRLETSAVTITISVNTPKT